jgi:ATP-dependent Lon protease
MNNIINNMARESQNKLSKKDKSKHSKKQEELNKKKKRAENSDSDSNEGSDTESDEMDVHEYRKFISKIFPSKHINKKIKAGEKLKKVVEEDEYDSEEEEEEEVKPKKKNNRIRKTKKVQKDDNEEEEVWETDSDEEKVSKKKNKKGKKSKKYEDSDDEEISLGSEDSDQEEEEEDDDYEPEKKSKSKLNIVFTIGGVGEGEDEWEDEDEYDSDYEGYEDSDDATEDEDEEVSTDDSDSESDEDEHDEEEEEEEEIKKVSKKKKSSNKKNSSVREENIVISNNTSETLESSNETLDKLKQLLEANPNDKSIQKCIQAYEEDLQEQKKKKEKKHKKQKAKNLRIFRKILRDKNTMNDFSFYEKLEMDHQKKIIKELREINKITRIEKPYRMTLLESEIPVEFKSAAMKKINSLRYMEPGSGEFYKSKNWVDTFMRIPFNKYEGLPISIEDGVEKCHDFMENAQSILDQAVYGLNDAKMQIMQMLGQLLTNPKAIGTAIAIHGPPGTGKTSLVKEGISKILNRPFAFIALGGATDSSFLEGHGYTYEGSTWGKIVQILIESKCMNPVIYFDELDKISDTPRGEEIAGILTHLTDTSQNSQFHDKYFAEINFDLSKCLFIFSYNDESKVNPILKDRMYRIKTKGYIAKEKTVIANNYLLPKIREQVRFNNEDVIISNDVLGHIIETHCNKEDGVRNLKRCLEIIYTKLNLYRLMKPGSNLFESEMSLKVEFPFDVTKDIVDKLIKRESEGLETWKCLYN